MGEKIALGKTVSSGKMGVMADVDSTEGRLQVLEAQLKMMTHAFYQIRRTAADNQKDREPEVNAYEPGVPPGAAMNTDGIPIGTTLVGTTAYAPYVLIVGGDGLYYVNLTRYDSLSAAAKGVGAPLRKSGWRFWKVLDGRSVREVYRKA